MSSLNCQANHSFLTRTRTSSIYLAIGPEPLYASQAYSGKSRVPCAVLGRRSRCSTRGLGASAALAIAARSEEALSEAKRKRAIVEAVPNADVRDLLFGFGILKRELDSDAPEGPGVVVEHV